jgi:hypothetical protein
MQRRERKHPIFDTFILEGGQKSTPLPENPTRAPMAKRIELWNSAGHMDTFRSCFEEKQEKRRNMYVAVINFGEARGHA